MKNENRAQTSIETLLLVGGAIAVAVIVGLAVKSAANYLSDTGQRNIQNTP